MSTNYYLRIIPARERVEELKSAIDSFEPGRIEDLTQELYGKPDAYGPDDIAAGKYGLVHLGKRAGGWPFLWNPNTYVRYDYKTGTRSLVRLYDLTKEGIMAFMKSFGDSAWVVDEYNERSRRLIGKIPEDEAERVKDKEYLDLYDNLGQWSPEAFMEMALSWGPKDWDPEASLSDAGYYRSPNEWDGLMKKEYPGGYRLGGCWYVNGLRFADTTDFS